MGDDRLYEAFKNWEILSGTQEQMFAYEGRLKRIFDEEAAVREAELRAEEAEQRGEIKGEIRGEIRGEEIGTRKGRRKEKEEVAHRLLTKGMDIEVVAEITELNEVEIREIKKQITNFKREDNNEE